MMPRTVAREHGAEAATVTGQAKAPGYWYLVMDPLSRGSRSELKRRIDIVAERQREHGCRGDPRGSLR
jgi:hypothetical protein